MRRLVASWVLRGVTAGTTSFFPVVRLIAMWVSLAPTPGLAADGGVTAAVASRSAIVRFHTSCAACHAAECSGRLSFDSGGAGAKNHVKRYAPTADEVVVRELFTLLSSLKRTCRYELPSAPSPLRYDAAFLREHFDPDASAWFVPLPARARRGVVELDVGAGQHAEVTLLDDALETLGEVHGEGALRLDVPASQREAYLLVRRAKSLSRVELR